MLSISLTAQTEAGRTYISLGSAYSPINQSNFLFKTNGMSFGNEWVTGITVDGDDDDNSGNDYWNNDDKDKTTSFNMGGQFGYFIIDNLLLGVGIEYASFSNKSITEVDWNGDGFDDERTRKDKMTSLAFSPFTKYYISLGQNAVFLSSSYSYGTMKSKYEYIVDYADSSIPDFDDDNTDDPYITSRFELGTGMSFFLTENISLEPSINYSFNTYTQEQEVYIGTTGAPDFIDIYDDQKRKTYTNAFYFKLSASMFL